MIRRPPRPINHRQESADNKFVRVDSLNSALPALEAQEVTPVARQRIPNTTSPIAFSHLITLSARYSTDGGIVRPICFAVFKLITSSNFFGCSTGSVAGLAPFKILST